MQNNNIYASQENCNKKNEFYNQNGELNNIDNSDERSGNNN
jgi:hypothetical protein